MLQDQVKESCDVCSETEHMCLEVARYCMEAGGDYLYHDHVRLFLDAAALCHTMQDTTTQATWLHVHATSACAAMCARTVEVCDAFPNDDLMVRCAKLCRECVKYCIGENEIPIA